MALPFVRPNPQSLDVPGFWIRRFFRIYPAYWVGIALALFLQRYCFNPEGLAALDVWIRSFWHHPLTPSEILDHIILIGSIDTRLVNPVIWSLKVEMRVSLIFPLLIFLLRRVSTIPKAIFFLLGSYVVGYGLQRVSGFDSFLALPLFAMGGLLARYYQSLQRWVSALPGYVAWLLGGGGIILYASRSLLPLQATIVSDTLTGLGGVLIIMLTLGRRPVSNFFVWNPVHFLGRISYSLYLIHLPLLISITSLTAPYLPLPLSIGLSLLCTLLSSWVLLQAIEIPFQRLGRYFAEWSLSVRKRLVADPT